MQALTKSINKQSISLKIPAEQSYISLARLVMAAQLRERFVDEEGIDDLKLALGEFLAKAIEAKIVNNYFSITLTFSGHNLMEIGIEDMEEFDPQELFSSPFLNFDAIGQLIDHFDLRVNEKQTFSVLISKRFVLAEDI